MWLLTESLQGSTVCRNRAGIGNALRIDLVRKLANDPDLFLAKEVLGEDAFAFQATLFDKSPRSNWLVAWHRDTTLPLWERQEARG
jgi:hypothetical protein